MKLRNIKVAYHRNGCGGDGFHVAHFNHPEGNHNPMVAVIFETPGQCAVLDISLLAQGVIGDPNKWRGTDDFEKDLRAAIAAYEATR
jgi:hypothetical protein